MLRTAIPAVSRLIPPGPSELIRRFWVISANGLVWSMYCDRGLDPKNSLNAAFNGFVLSNVLGATSFGGLRILLLMAFSNL
jgi:hypothetical protein